MIILNAIDGRVSNSGDLAYFGTFQPNDRPGQNSRVRKIIFVNRSVDRIDLDGCRNIETRLLEA